MPYHRLNKITEFTIWKNKQQVILKLLVSDVGEFQDTVQRVKYIYPFDIKIQLEILNNTVAIDAMIIYILYFFYLLYNTNMQTGRESILSMTGSGENLNMSSHTIHVTPLWLCVRWLATSLTWEKKICSLPMLLTDMRDMHFSHSPRWNTWGHKYTWWHTYIGAFRVGIRDTYSDT